jgi:hypothetical protein
MCGGGNYSWRDSFGRDVGASRSEQARAAEAHRTGGEYGLTRVARDYEAGRLAKRDQATEVIEGGR